MLGAGRHTVVAVIEHPENLVPFAKTTLSAGVIYNSPLFCTKVSILLLYYRLFPSKRFKWVCIAVGIFVGAYSITAIMTNIFQCVPVQSNWDTSITPHCVNLGVELVVVSSLNVLTDAIILVLPMPFIWKLNMDVRRKLQLTGLFLMGSFVVVVSIIRVTYVSQVSFSDGFWVNSLPTVWSIVENCLAIVAACLPVMRPVFNKLIYGSPDGRGHSKISSVNSGSLRRQHFVTIGGTEVPMEALSNGSSTGAIKVTNTTTIMHNNMNEDGNFVGLVDNNGLGMYRPR